MATKPYFYLRGLNQLADSASGNEHVFLGIRPHGFHAGNQITMSAFLKLFLERFERSSGQPARFKIFLFINDWEQDFLDGPDIAKYPFNVYPKKTTFQYTAARGQRSKSLRITDHWEPRILASIRATTTGHPQVRLMAVRNSELKNTRAMRRCVLFALHQPRLIGDLLERHSGRRVLDHPRTYALAVCPGCSTTKGETTVTGNLILHRCNRCGTVTKKPYSSFDYWLYHKISAIARLEHCKIDICLTGSDHFDEGDFQTRRALVQAIAPGLRYPRTLYTPLVLARDGRRMSKSQGNARSISRREAMKLARESGRKKRICL